MKKHRLFIIISMFLILFDFFKYDMIIFVDAYFFGMFLNMLFLFLCLLYLLFIIWSIFYTLVSFIRHKAKGALFVSPSPFIYLFLVFTLITNTFVYGVVNYKVFEEKRMDIIKEYEQQVFDEEYSDDLIGYGEYKFYSSNRLTSYKKTIYLDNKEQVVKAIFSCGDMANIVYISNGNIYEDGFFQNSDYLNSGDYRKINENWYFDGP